MARLGLIAVLLLASGCDDPDVEAKVLSVLEHGIVEARATCSCNVDWTDGGGFHSVGLTYQAQRLIDGACLVREVSVGRDTNLLERSHPQAPLCASRGEAPITWLEEGEIRYLDYEGAPVASEDINICCTGFNLEAFGVEP